MSSMGSSSASEKIKTRQSCSILEKDTDQLAPGSLSDKTMVETAVSLGINNIERKRLIV